jgi:hypothetical protein
MVRRHYISNRNWWLAMGIAAFTVTFPIVLAVGVTVGVTVGVNAGHDWFARWEHEYRKSGWGHRKFDGTEVKDTGGFAAWLQFRPEWTDVSLNHVSITEPDAADLAWAPQVREIAFEDCSFELGAEQHHRHSKPSQARPDHRHT